MILAPLLGKRPAKKGRVPFGRGCQTRETGYDAAMSDEQPTGTAAPASTSGGRNSLPDPGESRSAQARFGTFGGVFTPCVLTILGVIMFMRVGYVTGHSGLWVALIILGISKLITVMTTLSLSAIATNLDMRVGGVYFMISRVLGPDFGGSIGITLFFANAVGVAFYTIGFTEALFALIGVESVVLASIVSTGMVVGLFALTFKGADIALKAQYLVLVVLLLAVASFLIGGFLDFDSETFAAAKKPAGEDFDMWVYFAIFFPAATGITAGANMSGDLKNPGRSIPWGTLLAIVFTAAIYAAQIVLTAGASSREGLQTDGYQALQDMSIFFPLIIAGVFAATLSSALGSFLGAPRILQAMGQDRLMKVFEFFGKGAGPANEPRRATVLTLIIAILVIWLPVFTAGEAGESNPLNMVAEVISMFFLIAYGMINLSAFVESKSANPSFRPKFKVFHWVTALIGAIGCAVAMIKINDFYAMIAVGVTAIIYFYLRKRDIQTSYGDAKRGYIFQRTRDNLFYLEEHVAHPKNWRPVLVAITENPQKDAQLVRVGSWLESERGLYTVAHIAERSGAQVAEKVKYRETLVEALKKQLEAEKIVAFSESAVVDDYFRGLTTFLQSYSIGGLRPNTLSVSMPSPTDRDAWDRFLATVEILGTFDKSLAVLKPGSIAPSKKRRTIDLWWRGEHNGSLMALFAYLMTLNRTWSRSHLRVFRIVQSDDEERRARKQLNKLKDLTRIAARVEVIRSKEPPEGIIAEHSGPVADLVLLGMSASSGEEARMFFTQAMPLLEKLPTTVLIWSNGEADVFA
jgi:amino acid transporter